ncbi:MAG TPA: sulfatase-like hydrolase/transferase [Candidatus Latescibacteria bacterium]|nr:sulfatase-like hydrolase/transferase [Candidatus Latescibacterota bacterium]
MRSKKRTVRRPNVLFILSDQHNAKVLGCKGHPDVKTPHIDRLAAQGVRFENAITQSPICTPSRMSWLSGQYGHNHGYYGLSGPNPGGLPTVLGHFRKAGYRTAAIGKIHCPEYWIEDDADCFHETCETSVGGRSAEYTNYLEERGLSELEDHAGLTEFGRKGIQSVEGRPSRVSYEDGQEGWSVRTAMAFIADSVQRNCPFFAHVSLPKPHQCYTPAQRFWDLYDEARLTLPPNAEYDMSKKAPHLRLTAEAWRKNPWQLFEPKTFEAGRLRKLHGYLGNVSHVDHAVGELVDWIDANGLADDTIVIYSSDHGDYACEHGIMEKAPGICSDAITRIPMIWRWPGHVAENRVAGELVETVDFANTISALAGLDAMETADGKDLSHLLRGESGEVHRIAVTEFPWSKSVRNAQYRLVQYVREMFPDEYPDGFGELYDLNSDPWEMTNLFFDPAHADVVRDLQQELMDWLLVTTRPTTVLPAPHKTSAQTTVRYLNAVNADKKIHPDRIRDKTQWWERNYI